jgi:hypothetical protein
VLKRLDQAVKEKDHIYATVRISNSQCHRSKIHRLSFRFSARELIRRAPQLPSTPRWRPLNTMPCVGPGPRREKSPVKLISLNCMPQVMFFFENQHCYFSLTISPALSQALPPETPPRPTGSAKPSVARMSC